MLLFFCFDFAAAASATHRQACEQNLSRVALKQVEASAGQMANFFKRPQSIRAQSEEILNHALDQLQHASGSAWIEFQSIPRLAKPNNRAFEECAAYFKQTQTQRLKFDTQYFVNLEDMHAWIQDFSQGKGELGEQLYQACPGQCSPQYTWNIRRSGSSIHVDAAVVFGMPRDRDSQLYDLSTAIYTSCSD